MKGGGALKGRRPVSPERIVKWALWLSAGLNAAFAAALWSFARLYAPVAPIPGWTPWLAAACAFESTAVQVAVERGRLPRLLRFAEWMALLAGVHLVAGGGELLPGSSLAAWTETQGAGSAFAVLITGWAWGSAAAMADRLWALGPGPDHDLTAKRLRAPFDVERRLFSALLALLLLVAGAVLSFPERLFAGAAAVERFVLAAAVAVLLACGLLLLGLLSLLRAQGAWQAEGIWVSEKLPAKWVQGAAYTVAGAVGLALLLPGGWAFLSLGEVLEVFSLAVVRLLQGITAGFFLRLMRHGEGVEPGPDRSSPDGPGDRYAGSWGSTGAPGADDAVLGWVSILGGLLLGAALLLALAFVAWWIAAPFFQDERGRMPSLRELPMRFGHWLRLVWVRLAALLRRGAVRLSEGVSALWHALARPLRGQRVSVREAEEAAPSAPALFVRFLFTKLLFAAAREGLARRRSETAAEYGRRLKQAVEGAGASLEHLVAAYEKARYSRGALPETVKAPAQAAWRRVIEALGERSKANRRRDPGE